MFGFSDAMVRWHEMFCHISRVENIDEAMTKMARSGIRHARGERPARTAGIMEDGGADCKGHLMLGTVRMKSG